MSRGTTFQTSLRGSTDDRIWSEVFQVIRGLPDSLLVYIFWYLYNSLANMMLEGLFFIFIYAMPDVLSFKSTLSINKGAYSPFIYLDLTGQQHVTNMTYCTGWVQPFRTNAHTVHNTAATENAKWII